MRIPCSKCEHVTVIHSRPKAVQGRDSDGVYWRAYGVCPSCGTTSVYNWHGRAIHTPPEWEKPLSLVERKDVDQVELPL